MDIQGWEKLYRSGERGAEDQPTFLLVDTLQGVQPGRAVDLACGTGRNSIYLAAQRWDVTAMDGSPRAIELLNARTQADDMKIDAQVADLTAAQFSLAPNSFDLVLVAYYLERDLFAKVKAAVRPGGLAIAIAHIPEPGEEWSEKRARPGELRGFFNNWEIVWDYEGASRDPAHKRPVAEIVARRPVLS